MTSFPPAFHASTPPAPPPKPGSHETSRRGTPFGPPQPPPPPGADDDDVAGALPPFPQADAGPDPGEGWLPGLLQDKSCVISPSSSP